MPKDFRMQRISDLIRTTLSQILLRETEDKRFHGVTITRLVVSRDLNHARIYVSFMPDQDTQEMTKALNHAAKYLRYHLAQEIKLRVTPELRFYYDDSNVKGQRIADLLNKALKDEE
jgi:ribosome-binding factor A